MHLPLWQLFLQRGSFIRCWCMLMGFHSHGVGVVIGERLRSGFLDAIDFPPLCFGFCYRFVFSSCCFLVRLLGCLTFTKMLAQLTMVFLLFNAISQLVNMHCFVMWRHVLVIYWSWLMNMTILQVSFLRHLSNIGCWFEIQFLSVLLLEF